MRLPIKINTIEHLIRSWMKMMITCNSGGILPAKLEKHPSHITETLTMSHPHADCPWVRDVSRQHLSARVSCLWCWPAKSLHAGPVPCMPRGCTQHRHARQPGMRRAPRRACGRQSSAAWCGACAAGAAARAAASPWPALSPRALSTPWGTCTGAGCWTPAVAGNRIARLQVSSQAHVEGALSLVPTMATLCL